MERGKYMQEQGQWQEGTGAPAPGMGQPVFVQPPKRGLAIAGMILGIASIVPGFCTPCIGLPCAVVGLILSILGLKQDKTMATIGIICSIAGFAIAVASAAYGIYQVRSGKHPLINPDWTFKFR